MEETFEIAHKYASLEDVIVVTPSIMHIIECMIILLKNIGVLKKLWRCIWRWESYNNSF